MAVYTYSIETDFHNDINLDNLCAEIRASDISVALDYVNTIGDVVYIYFKGTLDQDDIEDLSEIISRHNSSPSVSDPTPVKLMTRSKTGLHEVLSDNGYLYAIQELPGNDKVYIHSPNWCDPCTWYENSKMVVEEILVDQGDGFHFISQNKNWIDMSHGRMTDEDYVIQLAGTVDTVGHKKWIPILTVDNLEKIESINYSGDNDYEIDYENGIVTFKEPQSNKIVKATYWYGDDGAFTIKPLPGKILRLVHVELQFSKDIVLADTMVFQAYGYLGVFAPQYVDNVNYFSDTLIPIGKPTYYKRAFDYINEANGIYPITPAWGGTGSNGWRGFKQDILTFPWKYMARTDLSSKMGMQIRIGMVNNTPHVGELATLTVYATSLDEE